MKYMKFVKTHYLNKARTRAHFANKSHSMEHNPF